MKLIDGNPKEQMELSALGGQIGEVVELFATVHKIRRMSGFSFVILRRGGMVVQSVYDPAYAQFSCEDLQEEGSARFRALVAEEPRARDGWELRLLECEILSLPTRPLPVTINGARVDAALDTLLNHRPLTLRNPAQQAAFHIQAALVRGFAQYLDGQGFVSVRTPKLVAAGAEGGASLFGLDYFGRQAYLAQSPQCYKQMLCGVFVRVYEIAPAFRAEHHDTAWHLNEFTSVDVEYAYPNGLEDILALERAMLVHGLEEVRHACGQWLALLKVDLPAITSIPAIRFREVGPLLGMEIGDDLTPEVERALCAVMHAETGSEFVFVTHYPRASRPFYTMDDPDDPTVTYSYDLLFRGIEVTSGAQRIHDAAMQEEKLRAFGLPVEAFEDYLSAHRAGLPPHGGFGLGLERLTACLLGFGNVRQATLFPRDQARLTP